MEKPCFLYAEDAEEMERNKGFYFRPEELPFPFARTGQELLGQSACSTKKELQSWGFDYTILFGEESILQDSSPDFYVENQGRTV